MGATRSGKAQIAALRPHGSPRQGKPAGDAHGCAKAAYSGPRHAWTKPFWKSYRLAVPDFTGVPDRARSSLCEADTKRNGRAALPRDRLQRKTMTA